MRLYGSFLHKLEFPSLSLDPGQGWRQAWANLMSQKPLCVHARQVSKALPCSRSLARTFSKLCSNNPGGTFWKRPDVASDPYHYSKYAGDSHVLAHTKHTAGPTEPDLWLGLKPPSSSRSCKPASRNLIRFCLTLLNLVHDAAFMVATEP